MKLVDFFILRGWGRNAGSVEEMWSSAISWRSKNDPDSCCKVFFKPGRQK